MHRMPSTIRRHDRRSDLPYVITDVAQVTPYHRKMRADNGSVISYYGNIITEQGWTHETQAFTTNADERTRALLLQSIQF